MVEFARRSPRPCRELARIVRIVLEALGFTTLFGITVQYTATAVPPYFETVGVFSVAGVDPTDAVTQIFDLLRTLTCNYIIISGVGENLSVPAAALGHFLDSLSCESIRFSCARFSLDQCLALSHWRRTLAVTRCTLEDAGRSIFEKVEENEDPSFLVLIGMLIDTGALAKALRMSTSLRSLYIGEGMQNFDMPQFLSALEQNCGLLCHTLDATVVEPFWFDLFRSLRRHPALLRLTFSFGGAQPVYAEDRGPQTRAIVDCLKSNSVLQGIHALPGQVDETIMENDVRPRLRVNISRPRIKALEEEGTDQRRLIGAALMHVRDPTVMWMTVSTFNPFVLDQYQRTQKRLSFRRFVEEIDEFLAYADGLIGPDNET